VAVVFGFARVVCLCELGNCISICVRLVRVGVFGVEDVSFGV